MKNNKGCWCDNCNKRKPENELRHFETIEGAKELCWSCELKLNQKTYGKIDYKSLKKVKDSL